MKKARRKTANKRKEDCNRRLYYLAITWKAGKH